MCCLPSSSERPFSFLYWIIKIKKLSTIDFFTWWWWIDVYFKQGVDKYTCSPLNIHLDGQTNLRRPNNQLWDGAYIILHPIFSSQRLGPSPIHSGPLQLPPPTLNLPFPPQSPPTWVRLPSPLPTKAWLRRNRGRCSRSTRVPSALPPTPPICTGSAVNPRKELTIQARTHTFTKSTAAQVCTDSTVVQLKEQRTHTLRAVQIPSVCLRAATRGSGLDQRPEPRVSVVSWPG